jgi:hypothetical protein
MEAMRSLLVAMATLLAVLAMIAGAGARWIDRQILSTPRWTATSSHLIADPPVRRAIAHYLVDQTFAGSGIDSALTHVLPGSLAGRADSGLRDAASGLSASALATGPGRRVWRDANRQAQSQLLHAVDHPRPGQRVVLNLTPLLHDVVRELLGTSVAQAIPGGAQLLQTQTAGAGKLVVLKPKALSGLRGAVRVTRFLSWALFVAALALLAFGLLMSRARLPVSLSRAGYAIALAGAVVLAARALLAHPLADLAVGSSTNRAAVHDAWLIGSTQLRDTGIELLIIGAVVAVGSWVVRALTR